MRVRGFWLMAGLAALMMSSTVSNTFGALGARGGPIVHEDTVLAYSTDQHTITFVGGKPARVTVIGDGDTDLDLYVYDKFGNLIDFDDDYTAVGVCEWTPKRTGKFTIRIKNRGGVYSDYLLLTN